MLIECASCRVQNLACGDCVVSALLGGDDEAVQDIDEAERAALDVLAAAGLIPPLRLDARPADAPPDERAS